CTLSNHLDQPTLESDFSQLRPPFQAIPVPNEPPHFPLSALPLLSLHKPLHQELGRSVKETSEGSKGDSAEFSAEV
ncbi:hypothetical protein Prudu_000575, partial [Prunus dulcis]